MNKNKKLELSYFLLKKYSDLINEKEKKTVREVKELINSEDLTVQSLVNKFKPENYSFEKHYLKTAKKLFDFLKKQLSFVELDIQLTYWLKPSEVMSLKLGDDEDLAILFCSILLALNDINAYVVIADLDDIGSHAFVFTKHEGKFYIFDLSQKHQFYEFSGNEIQVLQKYSFQGKKIKGFLYKFNATDYKEFV